MNDIQANISINKLIYLEQIELLKLPSLWKFGLPKTRLFINLKQYVLFVSIFFIKLIYIIHKTPCFKSHREVQPAVFYRPLTGI